MTFDHWLLSRSAAIPPSNCFFKPLPAIQWLKLVQTGWIQEGGSYIVEGLRSIACNLLDWLSDVPRDEFPEAVSDFVLNLTERIDGIVTTLNNDQSANFIKFPPFIPINEAGTTPRRFYSIFETQEPRLLSAFPRSQFNAIDDCCSNLRSDRNLDRQTVDNTYVERDLKHFHSAKT